MVINKSVFIVLIFSLLLCANGRRTEQEQDPRQQYEQCQRRCQRETRGEREQEQCEQSCERRYKEKQQGQQEDPQRKYEECQQQCEQQGYSQQPQCQRRCQRQFQEQQRRYQQCQERCEKQEQGQHEQQQCQRKCQQQAEEQQREQEEQPQKQYQECQDRCLEQQQGQKQRRQCQRKCREQYEEHREMEEGSQRQKQNRREGEEQEEEEDEEEQQRNNPYYFPYRRSFQTRFREEEGRFKVLQRFAEKSRLLEGIDNFRLAMFEANPNTLVLPHHSDTEAIYFVANGKGTITFATHENKESYNVERGTVVRVPAGRTVYMVNQDNKEKLTIVVLAMPVNNPGKFEEFFPAGNENPQSYLKIFSSRILETVLNTPREKLERLFEGQQKLKRQQGVFRRATPEQIRSMSQQETSPRQRGGERFAFNLLSQSPVYSNQNGRFFEACPNEFKQLQEMDVSVAALRINPGAIFVPHYNSKATFVVAVTEGNGYVEMACPHLSGQGSQSGRQDRREQQQQEEEREERTGEYKKVKARLSPGDVFVFPTGHPFTFVASKNENFQAIGFGINARNNQRIFLAGTPSFLNHTL
ncbi:hypothetical protein DITRI_Ditri08aG0044000 [Diplodiscus trichospermus]